MISIIDSPVAGSSRGRKTRPPVRYEDYTQSFEFDEETNDILSQIDEEEFSENEFRLENTQGETGK